MEKKQKRPYEQPTVETVWITMSGPLLTLSGGDNDGYGDPIDETDPNGWQTRAILLMSIDD